MLLAFTSLQEGELQQGNGPWRLARDIHDAPLDVKPDCKRVLRLALADPLLFRPNPVGQLGSLGLRVALCHNVLARALAKLEQRVRRAPVLMQNWRKH